MPQPRKPIRDVLAQHLLPTPCPRTHDVLGRAILGDCLVWQRSCTTGYGQVVNQMAFGDRRPRLVHRVSWALARGWDPSRVDDVPELDHLCRVTACASPLHLEPVTRKENLGRGLGNQNRDKEACINGHAFDEANTIREKSGGRHCRECKRGRAREAWRAKHRPDLLGKPAMSYSDAARLAGHRFE